MARLDNHIQTGSYSEFASTQKINHFPPTGNQRLTAMVIMFMYSPQRIMCYNIF